MFLRNWRQRGKKGDWGPWLAARGIHLESQTEKMVVLGVSGAPPQDQGAVEDRLRADLGPAIQIVWTSERPAAPPPPASPHMDKNPVGDIGVKHMIAVASGKGGVGKSTVATNLALALSDLGLKVGLLDADIYGPSIPMMMGARGQKPEHNDQNKLVPVPAHGIDLMSMGFLVDTDAPMIWRGPMVQSAIIQMLRDVAWAGRDVVVIDLPPGTGDAQLTLAQKIKLSGAVIVTTPQDVARLDARKGLAMFRKVDVPVLGIIENMGMMCCPHCGGQIDLFGAGAAQADAENLDCPYLGSIPLDPHIAQAGDTGTPIIRAMPEGDIARAYRNLARQVWDGLTQS